MADSSNIMSLVTRGNKVELLRLLDQFPHYISYVDTEKVTLLMEAAANNHINILTILLDRKCPVDSVNSLGRTALLEAACRGHPAVTLRLCQERPKLNYRNTQHPMQFTALMEAASRGHAGVVFWLCEAKATLDLKTPTGYTALTLASHNNRVDCVRVLLVQGASPGTYTQAVEVAAHCGHTAILEVLGDKRLQSPTYRKEVYRQLKENERGVLQDEVNYDACINSRKLPNINVSDHIPALQESFVYVAIHPIRANIILPSVLSPQTYPRPPFKFHIKEHTVRRVPFRTLPAFGSCRWIAHYSNNLNSPHPVSQHRQQIYQDALDSRRVPVLTIYDNGEWTYENDLASGSLRGKFYLYLSLNENLIKHNFKMSQYMKSKRTSWKEMEDDYQQHDKILHNEDELNEAWETLFNTSPAYHRGFQPCYCLTLKTGGELGENGVHTPLQVVECYLGRHLVLGHLVMDLAPHNDPWWLFCERNTDDTRYPTSISRETLIKGQNVESQTTTTTTESSSAAAFVAATGAAKAAVAATSGANTATSNTNTMSD